MSYSSWLFRVALLVAAMAIIACFDHFRHNRDAWKIREYSSILIVAALGALVGALNDQASCTISAEYFTIGKGISPGSSFRLDVGILGAHAGFLVGFTLQALFLIAFGSKRSYPKSFFKSSYSVMHLLLLHIIVLAVVCSALLAIFGQHLLQADLARLLNEIQTRRFIIVWGWHIGLYSGTVTGAIHAYLRLRKDPFLHSLKLPVSHVSAHQA